MLFKTQLAMLFGALFLVLACFPDDAATLSSPMMPGEESQNSRLVAFDGHSAVANTAPPVDMPRAWETPSLDWHSIDYNPPTLTPEDMAEPWTPPHPKTLYMPSHHTPALEEFIQDSNDIAKVKLLGVEDHVIDLGGTKGYTIQMALKFEVLEWLKGGNGNSPIWGLVGMEGVKSPTIEEARWKADYHQKRRRTDWDDRNAVVFFMPYDTGIPDHYDFGWLSIEPSFHPWIRWLPATSSWAVSGESGGQKFLWEYPSTAFPGQSDSSGASGASDAGIVSLNELRRMVGLTESEIKKRERSVLGYAVVNSSPPPSIGLEYFAANSHTSPQGNWIELIWSGDPVGSGVTGYRILRRAQADSSFIQLHDAPANGPPIYEDGDVKPETKYIYRLRAYNADGDIADARVAITTVAELEPLDAPSAPTSTPPAPSAATATSTPTATATATPTPATAPSDGDAPNAPTPTPTPTATPTATPEPPPPGGVSGQ